MILELLLVTQAPKQPDLSVCIPHGSQCKPKAPISEFDYQTQL